MWSLDALSQEDLRALMDTARRLRGAASGGGAEPLRGKNVALLCADPRDAVRVQCAASALGAHVAHLRPRQSQLDEAKGLEDTARLLGRLYDALDCPGMPPALLERVESAAGVPTFNGIGSDEHPTRLIADLLSMQAQCKRPLGDCVIWLPAEADAEHAAALRRVAALAGVELRVAVPAAGPARLNGTCAAPCRAAGASDADFYFDASAEPRLVPCASADGPRAGADDRHYVLQALLLDTLAATP